MQISFPKKLCGILLLTRKVFLTSWLKRSTWVDLKYFQNKVVVSIAETNCIWFLFLAALSAADEAVTWWNQCSWQIAADGCCGNEGLWEALLARPRRIRQEPARNCLELGKGCQCQNASLRLSVLTPVFFSYNILIWIKKFCFSLLAVTCGHIPLIKVIPSDDKQYSYLSLEYVLLPTASLASE